MQRVLSDKDKKRLKALSTFLVETGLPQAHLRLFSTHLKKSQSYLIDVLSHKKDTYFSYAILFDSLGEEKELSSTYRQRQISLCRAASV